jgi:transcriptional regulator with XRE-family HTH domain
MQRLRTNGGRTHAEPMPDHSLYREVRMLRGYTVTQAANRIGITQRAWSRRERNERHRVSEVVGLYRMSELSLRNYMKLLEKCR